MSAITPNNSITLNNWHYVAITWDGTCISSGVSIYINGIAKNLNRGDGGGSADPDAAFSLLIGNNTIAGNSYFTGLIDEVKIFNYALTPLQIRDDYNQGAVRFGN